MKARILFASFILCAGTALFAQTLPPPQNVLQLQASETIEAQQDLMVLRLSTAREGTSAAAVQKQLTAALQAALVEARKTAQSGQMDVRTGEFGLSPRHNRDGKLTGWSGTAELVLEGRDFERITQAAARIQTMTVDSIGFSLSREQRAKVEADAQNLAIDHFKTKAAELARAFGFSAYTLREVAVDAVGDGFVPRARVMAMTNMSAARAAPVPVEPGKTSVAVTVSGSVQLR